MVISCKNMEREQELQKLEADNRSDDGRMEKDFKNLQNDKQKNSEQTSAMVAVELTAQDPQRTNGIFQNCCLQTFDEKTNN